MERRDAEKARVLLESVAAGGTLSHLADQVVTNHLALLSQQEGDVDTAERIMRGDLATAPKENGETDDRVLLLKSNLANVLARKGSYEEAIALHEQVLRIR